MALRLDTELLILLRAVHQIDLNMVHFVSWDGPVPVEHFPSPASFPPTPFAIISANIMSVASIS